MAASGSNCTSREVVSASAAFAEPSRPRPLLLPAIALIAGIALSEATGPLAGSARGVALTLPPIAFVLLLVLRRTARRLLLIGLVVALASAVGFLRHQSAAARPADHIVNALGDEPTLTRLAGHIVSPPIERPPLKLNPFLPFDPLPRTQFVLALEELRADDPPTPAVGNVRVSVKAAGLALRLGQHVQLTGRIYRPSGPRNPGEMDWARWYRRQGIDAGLAVEGAAHVLALPEPASWTYRAVNAARSWARGMLLEPYADLETDASARLLDVMILGQRSTADQQLNEAFLSAGGLHFLAVSGFNVAVLAGAAWLLVRRILRRSRRTASITMLGLTLLFTLVTEPNAPILRATICVILAAAADMTARPFCALNWLSLAAAGILICDPNELFNAGFQLSFVQVLALITLVPVVYRRCFGRHSPAQDADHPRPREAQTLAELVAQTLVRWTTGLLLVTTCAYLVAQPLVLLHFQRFAPWGWFGSLLLTPLVTLITLFSLAKLAISALLPPLGALLGVLLHGLSDFLLWSVGLFEHLPYAVIDTQAPPVWLVLAAYAVLLGLVVIQPRRSPPGPDRGRKGLVATATLLKAWAGFLVVLAWIGWIVLPASRNPGDALHVLAIGNGSAMLLTTPDGSAAVCDAGTDTNSDAGETVARALRAVGVRRIDATVVSHLNFDHYSGLPTLARRMGLGRWLTNPYLLGPDAHSALEHLLAELPQDARAPPATLRAGDRLTIGDVTLEVLWPPDDLDETWKVNDCSLVVRLSAQGRTVLLTGDSEADALKALLAAERAGRISLKADVLIAPHHGQMIKNVTADFLAAVSPSAVIVSTRTPRPKLEALAGDVLGPAARVLLTGQVGAVTVRVAPGGELRLETPFQPAQKP
jgi:competence protein ComEC